MINVLITAMDAGNVPPGSRDTYLTLAAAHRVYYISRCEAMVIACEGVNFIKRSSKEYYTKAIEFRTEEKGVTDFTSLGVFLAVDSSTSVDTFIASNYNLFVGSTANWDCIKSAARGRSELHGMSLDS